ncbi:c-type cytochrome [soil metagenome]
MRLALGAAMVSLTAIAIGAAAQGLQGPLDWAYVIGPVPVAAPPEAATQRSLPGLAAQFTDAQIHDLDHTVDWMPSSHPPMPAAVASGRGGAHACGYCHLADGNGRPENMALAGLPAAYIERQVMAFATGTRRAERPGYLPHLIMAATARAVDPADLHAAALYFSQRRYRSHVKIVEAAMIAPPREGRFIYVLGGGPKVPLGQRIIVAPTSYETFELRDPRTTYTAFVPPGSLAAGAKLARGEPGGSACGQCHGAGLRGSAIAPPIAGRFPTGLARQLVAFRSGSRSGDEAKPMRALAAKLGDGQIVALATYVASLRP